MVSGGAVRLLGILYRLRRVVFLAGADDRRGSSLAVAPDQHSRHAILPPVPGRGGCRSHGYGGGNLAAGQQRLSAAALQGKHPSAQLHHRSDTALSGRFRSPTQHYCRRGRVCDYLGPFAFPVRKVAAKTVPGAGARVCDYLGCRPPVRKVAHLLVRPKPPTLTRTDQVILPGRGSPNPAALRKTMSFGSTAPGTV